MILSRKCEMKPVRLIFAIVLQFSIMPLIYSGPGMGNPLVRQCSWLYKANPKDCRTYFQCLNGRPIIRRCPKSLYWNKEGYYCDWQVRSGCKVGIGGKEPIGKPTKPKPSTIFEKPMLKKKVKDMCVPNTYKPYPKDCNKYIQCGTFGQVSVMSCTPGLHWDAKYNVCNWPAMADCKIGSEGSSGGASTSNPPTTWSTTTTSTTTTTTPTTTTLPPFIFSTPPVPSAPTAPPTTSAPTTETPTTTSWTTEKPTKPTAKPTKPPGDGDQTQYPILQPPSDFKVVCYFTGWAVYRAEGGSHTPAEIDATLCTHIIYAFGCMNHKTYKLEMCDPWIDGKDGRNFYGQIASFRKHGIKTLLAVGGWNDSGYKKWSEMLKDVTKMETFIQSVSHFLREHEFDGLDLDYEYPTCPQANCNFDSKFEKQAFVALVKGLRARCPPHTLLTAAVSCNENIIREAYDVPTLAKHLDFFNLMAYDFHGPWESKTGINSPLFKTPEDEQYLNTYHAIQTYIGMKAPPEKLCLGMPMYGQSYELSNVRENGIGAKVIGPGHAGKWTKQKGMLAYYEICSQNWTETVHDDNKRVGPYSYHAGSGQWVSHDSPGIIKEKCKLIKELGLGGGMIWALDLDDFGNKCGEGKYPLLSVLRTELLGPNNKRKKPSNSNNNSRKPTNSNSRKPSNSNSRSSNKKSSKSKTRNNRPARG